MHIGFVIFFIARMIELFWRVWREFIFILCTIILPGPAPSVLTNPPSLCKIAWLTVFYQNTLKFTIPAFIQTRQGHTQPASPFNESPTNLFHRSTKQKINQSKIKRKKVILSIKLNISRFNFSVFGRLSLLECRNAKVVSIHILFLYYIQKIRKK